MHGAVIGAVGSGGDTEGAGRGRRGVEDDVAGGDERGADAVVQQVREAAVAAELEPRRAPAVALFARERRHEHQRMRAADLVGGDQGGARGGRRGGAGAPAPPGPLLSCLG